MHRSSQRKGHRGQDESSCGRLEHKGAHLRKLQESRRTSSAWRQHLGDCFLDGRQFDGTGLFNEQQVIVLSLPQRKVSPIMFCSSWLWAMFINFYSHVHKGVNIKNIQEQERLIDKHYRNNSSSYNSKSITPNVAASLAFFERTFSFTLIISSLERLTSRRAAISKCSVFL